MTGELKQSARLRGVITKIVRTEIAKLAPPTRVGTVQVIDRDNNYCTVLFPGDATPLKVDITYGNQPRYARYDDAGNDTGGGDLVRIGGRPGAYYLMDVLTSSSVNQHVETLIADVQDVVIPTTPPANSPAVTSLTGTPNSLVAVTEAIEQSTLLTYYISKTSGFTPDPTTQYHGTTRSTVQVFTTEADGITPLHPDTDYYVRVIATNGVAPDPAPSVEVGARLDLSAVANVIAASLVAGFVLAGLIRVGNITIDPASGITIPQPNGGTITLPANGTSAIITAQFIASALTTNGPATFGDVVTLAALMTLNSSVAAPTQAAQLTSTTQSTSPSTSQSSIRGFCDDVAGTSWVMVSNFSVAPTRVMVDKVTGAVGTTASIAPANYTVIGITRLGSTYYVLRSHFIGVNSVQYEVASYDASWSFLTSWIYSGAVVHAFGNDGTNLLISYSRSSDSKPVIRMFTTAGVNLGTDVVGDTAMALSYVYSITGTSADFGSLRYVLGESGGSFKVFNATGVRQTADEWTPAGGATWGIAWDGTRFHHVDSTGIVYHYSRTKTTQSVTATHSITDGATAETAASTVASSAVSWIKRQWLKVELPPPPITPSGLYGKAYVGTSSTRRLQVTSPAIALGNRTGYLDLLDTASAVAPVAQSGSFATGGIGSIAAASNGFAIDGNSGGSVGTGGFRDSVRAAGYPVSTAHRAMLIKTATQNLVNVTNTPVTWQSSSVDNHSNTPDGTSYLSMVDIANNQVVIRKAGLYQIRAALQYSGALAASTASVIILFVNSVAVATNGIQGRGRTNNQYNQNYIPLIRYLQVGDTVTFNALQDSGGTMVIDTVVETGSIPGTFLDVMEIRG